NPEFTMLEFYAAYMDVNGMMDFAETMIKEAVAKANGGSLVVNFGGTEIDFSEFSRVKMVDAVSNAGGNATGRERAGDADAKALLDDFETNVEDTLIQPTFIIDYPKSISPLSKA